jgi:hypothetical protein
MGFGVVTRFIDHLYTRLGSKSNHSAMLLIFTVHKTPQHPPGLFQPAMSSPTIPWQQLLTAEIHQPHTLMPLLSGN